ncbi:WXG100-like domain-containing protein [Mycolicibacterium arenosum]|uniref:Outer membrane channel protein CpnT-like N-terminal domain-containing protein n=1 Tax=Mycolicibacterium arenosum TaxID=2952157 RepID=A0ABT1LXC8_9MYCO|nr:hypothetical protein [Mycolicibacterium sp. CAU 1645]MCP9271536.1 hypothetical protein [Mycolicibacterium sp. CAU 1645]
MDVVIPAGLQWVAYLAGQQWPQGSESAMRRIASDLQDGADELASLIPDLERVRARTAMVLSGTTASTADEQFELLFDGDYSVHKLADALDALGVLARTCGMDIEYAKLWIVSTLGIAAFEIRVAIANAQWTGGGSLAAIPVVEAVVAASIRAQVGRLAAHVGSAVVRTLDRTMVKQLLVKSRQDMTKALGQSVAIQAYQLATGHRETADTALLAHLAVVYGVGGAVQRPTGVLVGGLVGTGGSTAVRAVKGAATDAVAAGVGRAAGIVADGGQLDPVTVLGAAAKSSIKGAVTGSAAGGTS